MVSGKPRLQQVESRSEALGWRLRRMALLYA
jgi:hypothetical protein